MRIGSDLSRCFRPSGSAQVAPPAITARCSAVSYGCFARAHPGETCPIVLVRGAPSTAASAGGLRQACGRRSWRHSSVRRTRVGSWTGIRISWTARSYVHIRVWQVHAVVSRMRRSADRVVASARRSTSEQRVEAGRWPSSSPAASGTSRSTWSRCSTWGE